MLIPGDYQDRAIHSSNPMQRFWHEGKIRLIDKICPPMVSGKILDIGCGSGVITHHLASNGANVVGIDNNPLAIKYANVKFNRENINFVCTPIKDFTYEESTFNQIYLIEVIEHMHILEIEYLLKQILLWTRPGGTLLITTPNYNSMWPILEWIVDALNMAQQMKGKQHITPLTKAKISGLCNKAGWHVKDIGCFHFVAPFISILSQRVALRIESAEIFLRKSLPGNLIYCLCVKKN